jgi:16S rRNA processing protein RimM
MMRRRKTLPNNLLPDLDLFQQLETWDVLVGRVTGHWDRASLRIISFSDAPGRFDVGAVLCAAKDGKRRVLKVLSSRRQDKHLILDCGLTTEEAVALKNAELFVHVSMRPPLPEGEFYADQILGMKVQTENGRDLGEVEEILETPAHDIYCTPQVMIPAVPEHIVRRDFENNVITVSDLLDLEE